MKRMLQTLSSTLFVVLTVTCIQCVNVERSSKHHPHEWDYLVFTQEWPQVACLAYKVLNPSHVCNITKEVATWTVHGIWPSSNSGTSPAFCNSSHPFDFSEIEDLKPSLAKFWPNLYAHTPEDQLWAHEWDKHGTCAASLPALGDELSFFDQGLNWIKRYNMLNILAQAGIKPDAKNPVMAYDIEKAIRKALGVTPMVLCEHVAATKMSYIYELELCFDKNLELINCPKRSFQGDVVDLGTEECVRSGLVWYPPIEYSTSFKEEVSPSWAEKLLNLIYASTYGLL